MKYIINLGEISMNLVKECWIDKDKREFLSFLESFKREDKVLWTKNILIRIWMCLQ